MQLILPGLTYRIKPLVPMTLLWSGGAFCSQGRQARFPFFLSPLPFPGTCSALLSPFLSMPLVPSYTNIVGIPHNIHTYPFSLFSHMYIHFLYKCTHHGEMLLLVVLFICSSKNPASILEMQRLLNSVIGMCNFGINLMRTN